MPLLPRDIDNILAKLDSAQWLRITRLSSIDDADDTCERAVWFGPRAIAELPRVNAELRRRASEGATPPAWKTTPTGNRSTIIQRERAVPLTAVNPSNSTMTGHSSMRSQQTARRARGVTRDATPLRPASRTSSQVGVSRRLATTSPGVAAAQPSAERRMQSSSHRDSGGKRQESPSSTTHGDAVGTPQRRGTRLLATGKQHIEATPARTVACDSQFSDRNERNGLVRRSRRVFANGRAARKKSRRIECSSSEDDTVVGRGGNGGTSGVEDSDGSVSEELRMTMRTSSDEDEYSQQVSVDKTRN